MNILHMANDAWTATGWAGIAIAFVVLLLTYTVFSMIGFGSAVIAAPVLALRLPLTMVVPLLSLLDLVAALINTRQLSSKIKVAELLRLVPIMAIGSGVGMFLLMSVAPQKLMLGLGVFVILYSLYRLFIPDGKARLGPAWFVPFGLLGGLFGGMFGSGGFIFSIYLSHRLDEKEAIRATMTAMTAMSTLFRAAVFLTIGTYGNPRLLLLAVFGLPALVLGLRCGHHISLRISKNGFVRILCVMLIATGGSLIWRAIHGAL